MFRTIVCFILIFPLIFACTDNKQPKRAQAFQCLSSQSQCQINTDNGQFVILFNQSQIKVEEPFQIQLQYQGDAKLTQINAFMEGKNMFMGKIPVIFTPSTHQQTFTADVMVVACSEPVMQWRLWFTVELLMKNNQKTSNSQTQKKPLIQSFFIDFTSSY